MVSELILSTASSTIEGIESQQLTLDDALDRETPPEIRRVTGHLLINYFRHKRFIEAELMKYIHRRPSNKIWYLLIVAATQNFFQSGIAKESAVNVAVEIAKKEHADKFVNAILRKITKSTNIIPATPETVLPESILKKWKTQFSTKQVEEFTQLFLSEPEFSFRILNGMTLENFPFAKPLTAYGNFSFATAKAGMVLNHPALLTGDIYIQDPAAALAPSFVDYSTVTQAIDLCAAPGGKALMIAENLSHSAKLTAADISKKRQKLTKENFKIRNRQATIITAKPEEITGFYDLVFADVPCSNTGVFRRRPDSLWRFSQKSFKEVRALQRHILEEAARLTANKGQLVYSTCSIEPEENHNAIQNFLKSHKNFEFCIEEQLLPTTEHDGAYAAKLIKTNN